MIYREGGVEYGAPTHLYLKDASVLADASKNKWLQTLVDYIQSLLAYYEGNIVNAAMLLETTMRIAQESQYRPDLARSLIPLGRVISAQGNTSQAIEWMREGLALYHRLGHKLGVVISLEGLSGAAVERNASYSAKLFGFAEAIRNVIGAPMPSVDHPLYESDVARIRAQLGGEVFALAWSQGKAMSLE